MKCGRSFVRLVLLVLVLSGAKRAEADWIYVGTMFVPGDLQAEEGIGGLYAYADTCATGTFAHGRGFAKDLGALFADIGLVATVQGLLVDRWIYVPDPGLPIGEVEVNVLMSVAGIADCVNADCAAAALGFVEFTATRDGASETHVLALEKSAGETSPQLLASIDLGAGISVPFTIGKGEQEFIDQKLDTFQRVYCPVRVFFAKYRSCAYIQVYANENIGFEARSEASMEGAQDGLISLIARSQCDS